MNYREQFNIEMKEEILKGNRYLIQITNMYIEWLEKRLAKVEKELWKVKLKKG